jgi:GcrA cell cycle regulator
MDMIEMFNAGSTMLEIATKYQVNRGAIAGVISRARKAGVLTIKTKAERPKPVKVEKPKLVKLKALPPEPAKKEEKKPKRVKLKLITDEFQVTIHELQPHHCRYPIGDPRQPDFRYCGRFQYGNGPYCLEHQQLCYTPPHMRHRYFKR